MPRYKLIAAREKAELSISELAKRIGCERKAVNRWERGDAEPRMEYRAPIRRELKNDDPDLFTNFEHTAQGIARVVQERSNMVNARIAARLTQKQVAEKIKVGVRSIINWERGHTTPYLSQIEGLRSAIKFTGTDEELLQVFVIEKPVEEPRQDDKCPQVTTTQQLTAPCQTDAPHDKMDSSDSSHSAIPESDKELSPMDKLRRAINNAIGTTLVGVNLQVITAPLIPSEGHTGPTAPPEEYIPQCTLIIESCWEYLNQANYNKLERALQRTMPTLRRCANTRGPYQNSAASLAVQANIMQMLFATRKHNFVARETFCAEAVHFGRLSGNSGILATALEWQGNTYTVCYHQPQTAIRILDDALSSLDNETLLARKDIWQRKRSIVYTPSLSRSAIYSNLSIAYAQEGDEVEAMKYAEMARSAMPTYPELDLFSQYIRFNHSGLDLLEGIAFLYLAGHAPKSDYAQKAHDAFDEAASKQAVGPDDRCSSLIRRADAARALGDMNGFVGDLTDGFRIAFEMDSIRRFSQASDVISSVPPEWKQETAVQDLQKDISHAIVVARR